MDNRFTIQFNAIKDGQLLREAIAEVGISKRALTAIKFNGGEILVNETEQNVRYLLAKGDHIAIKFPHEEASEGLIAEQGNLNIVYEDEYVLVIDKPAYQSTIPSREHPTKSIANVVLWHLQQANIASTVHVVTRLDRDTSGLMCIAKHRHIHHLMSQQQKSHEIHREYEAIVHGIVETQSIIAPIGRKETSIIEREVREDGQFAHTDVTLIKTVNIQQEPMSHVRLKLHTGRTHQIRVHMGYIGHPLIGDGLYGGSRQWIKRQALHCAYLHFIHPITKQQHTFTSTLAPDMRAII